MNITKYKTLILTLTLLLKSMNSQTTVNKTRMPIVFVGHGNPMNAIENNKHTLLWRQFGKALPKPKAILSISAHWETQGVYVTAMGKPKTIHDFGGFPQKLFQVQYPAPGNPQLAQVIANKLKDLNVKQDKSDWGLDHGTWSILVHMFPKADIPVLQLSLNKQFTLKQHYEFARNLQWLRDEGVLIMGSGNIVHHLGFIDWENIDSGHPWAIKMRAKSNQFLLKNEHEKLINYKQNGPEFVRAINSEEHYLPLLYILGLEQKGEKVTLFNDDLTMGSLSMTSVLIADPSHEIHAKLESITNNGDL